MAGGNGPRLCDSHVAHALQSRHGLVEGPPRLRDRSGLLVLHAAGVPQRPQSDAVGRGVALVRWRPTAASAGARLAAVAAVSGRAADPGLSDLLDPSRVPRPAGLEVSRRASFTQGARLA